MAPSPAPPSALLGVCLEQGPPLPPRSCLVICCPSSLPSRTLPATGARVCPLMLVQQEAAFSKCCGMNRCLPRGGAGAAAGTL